MGWAGLGNVEAFAVAWWWLLFSFLAHHSLVFGATFNCVRIIITHASMLALQRWT